MRNNRVARVVVLVIIAVVVGIIVYPKLFSTPSRQAQNSEAGTLKQAVSPGEQALERALRSGKPTMILFHSNSCIPCKEMSAIVAQIEPQFKDRANFVDILFEDKAEADLIAKYGVHTIPTSVFLDKRGSYAGTNVGVIKEDALVRLLDSLEQ
jgi:thioredoxin 1